MKLMVNEVLEVLMGVQKILQHYRGSKVTDMLDDIYLRCCAPENIQYSDREAGTDKPVNVLPAEAKPVVSKTGKKKRDSLNAEQCLHLREEIERLEREQAETLLNSYTIKQLCSFADWGSISVQKSARKEVIIGQITNHFGFRHLNMKMAQRPDMVR
ncbi:MAG TPA: hypothetical protein DD811_04335 [Syntrophomonas sp.]|nr:hypothetical protein [Syntrophomonas sp.]